MLEQVKSDLEKQQFFSMINKKFDLESLQSKIDQSLKYFFKLLIVSSQSRDSLFVYRKKLQKFLISRDQVQKTYQKFIKLYQDNYEFHVSYQSYLQLSVFKQKQLNQLAKDILYLNKKQLQFNQLKNIQIIPLENFNSCFFIFSGYMNSSFLVSLSSNNVSDITQRPCKHWNGKGILRLFPNWRHEAIAKSDFHSLINSSRERLLSFDIIRVPKVNFRIVVKQLMVFPFFNNYYEIIMFLYDINIPNIDLILLLNPLNNQVQISQLTQGFLSKDLLQNPVLKIINIFPNFYEKANY